MTSNNEGKKPFLMNFTSQGSGSTRMASMLDSCLSRLLSGWRSPRLEQPCVLILVPELSFGDAVSRDVLSQREAFEQKGIAAYIFAQFSKGGMGRHSVSRRFCQALLALTTTRVVYHHAVFWPLGHQLLSQAKGAKYLRYHGITPTRTNR